MNWQKKVDSKELKVGVIGLGYVGLPLAVEFSEAGFHVTGFDVSEDKVNSINQGESPVSDIDSDRLASLTDEGLLRATGDMTELEEMDTLHICVPTPLRKSRDPDISYIVQTIQTIVENFEPPGLVTLESTTYPGTSEEILADAFEEAGWDLEEELLVAFSPERIDPGNEEYGLENTPKVVGGYSDQAGEVAESVYNQVAGEVVRVTSTREAEMVKLLENTFRSINIGLVNEMALICDRLDINVWEVIEAAATKPFGFMPFYPGPGLGGHCIPIDPLFLSWRARFDNATTRFIELADEINRSMPEHVYSKITEGLNKQKQSVNGSRLCVFGVAYKPDVSDTRESPAYEVIEKLLDGGASVHYCDPYVEEFSVNNQNIPRISRREVAKESFDAGIILTSHQIFDWTELCLNFTLLVDTRNGLAEVELPSETKVILL